MVAEQDISKGDKLVSVPRKLWLTSETARESDSCGEFLQKGAFDNWQVPTPILGALASARNTYALPRPGNPGCGLCPHTVFPVWLAIGASYKVQIAPKWSSRRASIVPYLVQVPPAQHSFACLEIIPLRGRMRVATKPWHETTWRRLQQ